MMKRIGAFTVAMAMAVVTKAQVVDAFQGILPVTDPAMKRSLNGEWRLKVVEGITDSPEVPALDGTWGNQIPGPFPRQAGCQRP